MAQIFGEIGGVREDMTVLTATVIRDATAYGTCPAQE
jgi:hypothetical protein